MSFFVVELMLVFVLAVLLGIAFRYFGMPSIVGHVLAGLMVSSVGLFSDLAADNLRIMGTVGVTLLLFLVGLELNWSEVRKVTGKVLPIFLWQTILIALLFAVMGIYTFGFSWSTAVFFSIAMSFCSTIVVVKVLSEKRDLASLPGKVSLGILLFQDFLAILFMIFISHHGDGVGLYSWITTIGKLMSFCLLIYLGGKVVVSGFMKSIVRSSEDLILLSISWLLFSVYVGVNWLGVVPEVAGFLAGVSLATYWGHVQIVSKIKTVRDFFLTLFFVYLGIQIDFSSLNWLQVFWFCLMVVFGKFLITFLGSRISKLNPNTSFRVALNMTQLSEFSLVVVALGFSRGLWGLEVTSLVSVVGLLSMVISTWMMSHASVIYGTAKKRLPAMFKGKVISGLDENFRGSWEDHIVLVGADRTGRSLLNYFKKDQNLLVVDFNPSVVEKMVKSGIQAIFGDATDPETLESANMVKAKMIISTIKDFNDTKFFLKMIKDKAIKAPVLVDAESNEQAKELYKSGADYVIFPHFVSGHHLNQVIKKYLKTRSSLKQYRERQTKATQSVYG